LYPVTSYQDIKSQLDSGRPILSVFDVYQSKDPGSWFVEDPARPGLIEAPAPTDELIGKVATTIVDFDEITKTISFAHTWGREWGDSGFGTMGLDAAQALFREDEMWAVEIKGASGFAWHADEFAPAPKARRVATRRRARTIGTRQRARAPKVTIREPARRRPPRTAALGAGPQRAVYDAKHEVGEWSGTKLPATALVRGEGDPPTGDEAVDLTYDALGAFHQFFVDAYGRDSYDGRGSPLEAVVHYGREFNNAAWDGRRILIGDGDGRVFNGFHRLDVVAKECANGVIHTESDLAFDGESGALVQSLGCIFASLVKQYALGQTAENADWLIGDGLLAAASEGGSALISMLRPGSAHDDQTLGMDRQVGHMSNYVRSEDPGSVYVNSGIANRAFAVAARTLRGRAWTRAGLVWYTALLPESRRSRLSPRTTFRQFARRTVTVARERYPEGPVVAAIRKGWAEVGIDLP
jgi:hypothetical protein